MKRKLRLYLRFANSTLTGPGFTLALADSSSNQLRRLSPPMCGANSHSTLGYAGAAAGFPGNGIKPPKLAVEFDMQRNYRANDPGANHLAIVYWGFRRDNGSVGTGDDDLTHRNGIAGDASQPLNPRNLKANPAGITTIKLRDPYFPYARKYPTRRAIHVRLEIDKYSRPDTQLADFDIVVYLSDGPRLLRDGCSLQAFVNLDQDLAQICPQRTASIVQRRIPVSGTVTTPFAGYYLGLTTARSAQRVIIQELQWKSG